MAPFLPFSAAKCAGLLGLSEENLRWSEIGVPLPEGQRLGEVELLFKRIEA